MFFPSVSNIILVLITLLLWHSTNFGPENDNGFSFISLRESRKKEKNEVLFPESYNITKRVPKLFESVSPLELKLKDSKIDIELFKYSNTSKALSCYESLPQYTLIKGIMSDYSYFLTEFYRLRCEHNHEYHDGSKCGDTLFVIDLLENEIDILGEKFAKKKRECFNLEANAISVQSRYYNSNGFVGRSEDILTEFEILMIERSFLRRTISQFEMNLMDKSIEYERFCFRREDTEKSNIDCYLLRLECWLLEGELLSLSEEYFKRLSRFTRLGDTKI
ncbi:hypothetical protein HWI79_2050 [Cryptosporidium felis]|nr:hypothetical protein HWI79_2050 [Cryptosporidium felis]